LREIRPPLKIGFESGSVFGEVEPFQRKCRLSMGGLSGLMAGPFMSAMVDHQARKRIEALEERAMQRDRETAELSAQLSRAAADFARLAATIEAIRASRPHPSPAIPSTTPAPPQALPPAPSAVALPAAPAGFASLMAADFSALFPEFRGKRFTLLWRGGRDGFGARDFHGRCDGHAATLTLIQDTDGKLFGGFTPVEWESRRWNGKHGLESNCWKADPSLKSFLFTLKNPHNFLSRTFALKPVESDRAILCDSSRGPSLLWHWYLR
jgi:hypothetical protein